MFHGQFFPKNPLQFEDGRPQIIAPADATITFLQFASSNTDLTTYTFAAQNIGTSGNSRYIGIVANCQVGAAARTVSSVTVDGASLSFVRRQAGAANLGHIEIWFGAVSSANTTGDIVVTWSAAVGNCQVGVFECHNIQSGTATATDVETADNTAMTGSVSAGGIVIAGSATGTIATYTWGGGVTDHGDQTNESNNTLSVASLAYASAGTATATPDASVATSMRSVMATFR